MSVFLVAGSIAYDQLLTYDGSFVDGIDTGNLDHFSVGYVTRHFARRYGGTAANIAWNLRLLRQEVYIAGSVGRDGEEYLDRLKGKGINTALVRRVADDVCSTAIVGTDSREHQITFFHPGADSKTTAPDLSAVRDLHMVIVSPHSETAMEATVMKCRELKVPYLFDPGQQSLQFGPDELLRIIRGSAGLIVNSYEWSLVSEKLTWSEEEAVSFADLLVITRGEEGLTLRTKEEVVSIPAVPASKLVNPTGAGDALRAGLMTGLGQRWSLRDAGRLGAALASFVVEAEGTQLESFSLGALYDRAEGAYGETLPKLEGGQEPVR